MSTFNETIVVPPSGDWQLQLPVQLAGTREKIELLQDGQIKSTLNDVLFGDVWLCSGQSNMGLKVRKAANPERTAKQGEEYPIRIMEVARNSTVHAEKTLKQAIPWSQASIKSLPNFSSVCWEFAKTIYQATERPLGLVHSSWGGTTIEDWISHTYLAAAGEDDEVLDTLSLYAAEPETAIANLVQATEKWADENDKGIRAEWYQPDHKESRSWSAISLPAVWERTTIKELANFNGVIWFRRTFTISAKDTEKPAVLRLGRINERDTVWINGQLIGQTFEPNLQREYLLPSGSLQAGENTIVIRVIDERGSGGFSDYPNRFGIFAPGQELTSLRGQWHYKISASAKSIAPPPIVPWMAPRGYTTLYNGMISPLGNITLKGVVWYQGESNTGYAQRYEKLLPTLIQNWRAQFQDNELPFVIAQLPGFGNYSDRAGFSRWAELREAQYKAAEQDPHVGLAVLIDRGMNDDPHPSHKQEPGKRMAIEALKLAYDKSLPSSPYPVSVDRKGESLIVKYPSEVKLKAMGADVAIGFQICTVNEACEFRSGRVKDNVVQIPSAAKNITHIKYAWQDMPIVNLYGIEGLPAAPFNLRVNKQ
ncbi:sialate O-acetylesterase [Bowmanella dokdonensis]|uniref:Beta galactosidase jelly roll domain-containing protein n=1 Tax=Bowmanella dokdonensis TaxID=751969 RepID=A0A939DQY2_9ALTE|nr:sialate O-acetylesterase [Bowmanella dokdonensis]MBN7827150.1 beta galactosidase jelly roll domain-containing protein [Bowmanella dokdonensis]